MLKWDIRNASALIPIKTLYFFISLNNVQAFPETSFKYKLGFLCTVT